MTLQWIADKLKMGTAGSLADLPHNKQQNKYVVSKTDPF
jgi:hypothetical protein